MSLGPIVLKYFHFLYSILITFLRNVSIGPINSIRSFRNLNFSLLINRSGKFNSIASKYFCFLYSILITFLRNVSLGPIVLKYFHFLYSILIIFLRNVDRSGKFNSFRNIFLFYTRFSKKCVTRSDKLNSIVSKSKFFDPFF